jgi:hypothetical protein
LVVVVAVQVQAFQIKAEVAEQEDILLVGLIFQLLAQ